MRRIKSVFGLVVVVCVVATLWLDPGRLPAHMPITISSAMQSLGLWRNQTAQLHEVADLMLEIYQTLARMRYLDPSEIQRGPHNITNLLPVYEGLGLDASVVQLYSLLPYISPGVARGLDFLQGGQFADFRDPEDVEQGRDPFYGSPDEEDFDDENGPYMRPWMTPLSNLGNHQSVILYDTRKHRIWIIDQESWESTDLALEGVAAGRPRSKNRNNFEHIPSRPAADVLRDINRWYLSLEVLPGDGDQSSGIWDEPDLKALYRAHGWPDQFDGDAFQIAQVRGYAVSCAKGKAEAPLQLLDSLTGTEEYLNRDREQTLKAYGTATELDDIWIARYKIWKLGRSLDLVHEQIKKAEQEANRRCPGGVCQRKEDLPLWEMEQLQEEYMQKKDWLENQHEEEGDDNDPVSYRDSLRRDEREVAVYQRAYEAAKSDAERLCPGRSLEKVAADDSSDSQAKHRAAMLQQGFEELTEWARQLPSGTPRSRKMVDQDLEDYKRLIRSAEQQLQRLAASG